MAALSPVLPSVVFNWGTRLGPESRAPPERIPIVSAVGAPPSTQTDDGSTWSTRSGWDQADQGFGMAHRTARGGEVREKRPEALRAVANSPPTRPSSRTRDPASQRSGVSGKSG